jgi:hypothetical protein
VPTYEIYRSTTSPVQKVPGNLVWTAGSMPAVDSVPTEGTYYYLVAAANGAGMGIDSNEAQATVPDCDRDDDGVNDDIDNCADHANQLQINSDLDSWGDACDNCRMVDNEDQMDSDGDCPPPPYLADPQCGDACSRCLGPPPEVDPASVELRRVGLDLVVTFDDSLRPDEADYFNVYRGVIGGPHDTHAQVQDGCGIPGPEFVDSMAADTPGSFYYVVTAGCVPAAGPPWESSCGTGAMGERSSPVDPCP